MISDSSFEDLLRELRQEHYRVVSVWRSRSEDLRVASADATPEHDTRAKALQNLKRTSTGNDKSWTLTVPKTEPPSFGVPADLEAAQFLPQVDEMRMEDTISNCESVRPPHHPHHPRHVGVDANMYPTTLPHDMYQSDDGNDMPKTVSSGNVSSGNFSGSLLQTARRDTVNTRSERAVSDDITSELRQKSKAMNVSDDSSEESEGSLIVQPLFEQSVPAFLKRILDEATVNYAKEAIADQLRHQRMSREVIIAVVILLNGIFIGWQVQYRAVHQDTPLVDYIGGMLFCVLFAADILIRLYIDGVKFFEAPDRAWNLFDTVIVLLMLAEEIIRLAGKDSSLNRISILRTFRLLRFVRIVNIVPGLKYFQEFRILVNTMLCGTKAMLWVMLLIATIAFIAGIAMTEGTYDQCAGNQNKHKSLCKHFGRLEVSILSLYKAMLSGALWGDYMDDLLKIDWLYPLLFLLMISFVIIILANSITAIVIEMVADIHKRPEARIKDKADCINKLSRIFQELDPNNSGDISLNELKNAFDTEELAAKLATLQLDVADDARTFFDMLDRDQTGVIPRKEFVLGCLRLKGEAKALDVMRVQQTILEVGELVKNQTLALMDALGGELPVERRESGQGDLANSNSDKLKLAISNSDKLLKRDRSSNKLMNRENRDRASAKRISEFWADAVERTELQQVTPCSPLLAVGGGCRIPKTEERAMSLKQLQKLKREIVRRCPKETWVDMMSGASVEPDKVNLYHLNYNHICPLTTPSGVTLQGMDRRKYVEGQRVIQYDPQSTAQLPLAEGVVKETTNDTTVRVIIRRGIFMKTATSEKPLQIKVDDVLVGEGVPVEAPDAFSYKELVSTEPQRPRWFCCHWWGEKVAEFVACCETHTKLHGLEAREASFWVCAYANCQHDLGADITVDPENSSFRRAMRLAEGILLILDADATPFRRIWCDFELYKTIAVDKKRLDIVTFHEDEPRLISEGCMPHETLSYKSFREQKFPIRILVEGMRRPLEKGDASVDLDKKRILESMARDVPITDRGSDSHDARLCLALKRANNALHAYFALAAWPFAVNAGIVDDFDTNNRGTLNLTDILKQDEERQRLTLSLAHSKKIADQDVQALALGLPPNLDIVHLSFDGCPNITDASLQILSENLPRDIRGCTLDFSNCKELTDIGISMLMQGLPASIEDLELYFANCREISVEGALLINTALPRSIVRLNVGLTGTKVNKTFASVAALRKFGAKTGGSMVAAIMPTKAPKWMQPASFAGQPSLPAMGRAASASPSSPPAIALSASDSPVAASGKFS